MPHPTSAAGHTLSVGELREALDGVPDNTRVGIAMSADDTHNVGGVRHTGLDLVLEFRDTPKQADDEIESSIEDLADAVGDLESEIRSLARKLDKRRAA